MEKNKTLPVPPRPSRLRWIALVGILSAITYLLYLPLLRIPIILYLEINLSEVVMFIGGFSLGPLAAIFIGLFRFLFSLPFTTTGSIGELADLLYSFAFVLPSAIMYQRSRTKNTALIGFLIGFFLQLTLTSVLNAFVITDLYLNLFLNLTPAEFLGYIHTALPQVENPYWSLVLWMYLPFNLIKNTLIITLTLVTYKRMHRFLKQYA